MDPTTHLYVTELSEHDPRAQQPEKITTPLKPHQLAALQKAIFMEQHGSFHTLHTVHQEPMQVYTNLGILGDIVGYGKTLEALAIIAATPPAQIFRNNTDTVDCNREIESHARLQIVRTRNHPEYIPTTLVIVPHGPVFDQWKRAIANNTTLNAFVVNSIRDLNYLPTFVGSEVSCVYEAFGRYDLVLVKTTTLSAFMNRLKGPEEDYTGPEIAFARLMLDEAHETLYLTPSMKFGFLWMISATYRDIGRRRSTYRQLMSTVQFVYRNTSHCLVRNQEAFTRASFTIPELIEHTYMCRMPYGLGRIQRVLNHDVRRLIEANDFQGAMRALNMESAKSETEIMQVVVQNLERDMANLQRKRAYLETLDMDPIAKANRIAQVESKMQDIRSRMNFVQEQTAIGEQQCAICFEDLKSVQDPPIRLPCAHVFCTPCIFRWTYVSGSQNSHNCPNCRQEYLKHQMQPIALPGHSQQAPQEPTSMPALAPPAPETRPLKEEALLQILQNNPAGRFLVFSSFDGTFTQIEEYLTRNGIRFAELKGTTSQMLNILDHFRNNHIQCILLNTRHTGSGIDISFATDIILYHSNMGAIREQAIGRAQRVGRTEPLRVHNLVYETETA